MHDEPFGGRERGIPLTARDLGGGEIHQRACGVGRAQRVPSVLGQRSPQQVRAASVFADGVRANALFEHLGRALRARVRGGETRANRQGDDHGGMESIHGGVLLALRRR